MSWLLKAALVGFLLRRAKANSSSRAFHSQDGLWFRVHRLRSGRRRFRASQKALATKPSQRTVRDGRDLTVGQHAIVDTDIVDRPVEPARIIYRTVADRQWCGRVGLVWQCAVRARTVGQDSVDVEMNIRSEYSAIPGYGDMLPRVGNDRRGRRA